MRLASDKVRFVGEAVAMCVAESRAQAEDILDEIELDIDELPAIVSVEDALAPGPTRLHEDWPDNSYISFNADYDFEKGARGAPVIVSRTMSLSRQVMVPMEGKGSLAYWDDRVDQLVLYSSTQVPHMIRSGVCVFLHLEQHQVRVVAPHGAPWDPVTNDELVAKFHALTDRVTDRDRATAIERAVVGLRDLADVGNLIDLLAPPVAGALD